MIKYKVKYKVTLLDEQKQPYTVIVDAYNIPDARKTCQVLYNQKCIRIAKLRNKTKKVLKASLLFDRIRDKKRKQDDK